MHISIIGASGNVVILLTIATVVDESRLDYFHKFLWIRLIIDSDRLNVPGKTAQVLGRLLLRGGSSWGCVVVKFRWLKRRLMIVFEFLKQVADG